MWCYHDGGVAFKSLANFGITIPTGYDYLDTVTLPYDREDKL